MFALHVRCSTPMVRCSFLGVCATFVQVRYARLGVFLFQLLRRCCPGALVLDSSSVSLACLRLRCSVLTY